MKRYTVRLSSKALKVLKKLDKPTRALLYTWIETNINGCTDPRHTGKALSGNLKGAWRYRVGDYRIIADIRDEEVLVLVINIGHRSDIYKMQR